MPNLVLHCVGPMYRPVSVAQALAKRGLGLRESHEALNGLAEGKRVVVWLPTIEGASELRRELAELNVAVEHNAVNEAKG